MKLRTAILLAMASQGYIAAPTLVHAQGDTQQSENLDVLLEEVTVTGSRIKRDGYSAPTPVTVASTEELTQITPTHLADGLNKLPQFQMSSSPSRGLHNWPREDSHGNLLNLRSLGPERTLILMDGMRLPATNIPGTFDVSVLPQLLMDRVEIVTGGASAAYGADAVAGVANFVLDKDYTGFKGQVQTGVDDHGDNENYRTSVAGGFEFSDGKGHILLSAEKYENDGMLKSDRSVNNEGWMYLADANGVYGLVRDGRLNLASSGGFIRGPADFSLNGYKFEPDGSATVFDRGTPGGVFTSGGDGFTIPFDTSAVAEQDNQNLFGRVSYEFTDTVRGYAQVVHSVSETSYTSLSNSLNGVPFNVYSGNPFIPADVQAAMDAEGIDAFQLAEYGGDTVKPRTVEETEFTMIGFGLEGTLGSGWNWNVDFNYGKSEKTSDQHGQYEWAKVYAALDAVVDGNGNIVCNATLDPRAEVRAAFSDCVPLNVIGGDPATMTPEGYAYASGTSSYNAEYEQTSLSAVISGSAFEMPAGPVDVAFGVDYRTAELTLKSNSDPALLDNFDVDGSVIDEQSALYGPADDPWLRTMPASQRGTRFWLSNQGVADASEDVYELFTEVNVPLLNGKPGFQSLDVNGAFRYTDYETSGSVETWKLGTQWRINDTFLFRGTVSRDIRAPSLYSLGRGDSFRIGFLDDPVSGVGGNITQVEGASKNLEPEESDSFTFGFVITPESIPNLSLAVDYYSMEIEGAISAGLNAVEVVNRCAESGGTAPECAQISRPSPTEFPTSVRIVEGNFSFLETAGIDFEAHYSFGLGDGQVGLHLTANYLETYETQANGEASVLDWVGKASIGTSVSQGRPEWMGMFNASYTLGSFTAVLSEQYIHSQTIDRVGIPTQFQDNSVDAVWYTDLTLMNDFAMGDGNLQVFFTVNNLFDKEPPLIPSTLPSSTPVTLIGVYDHIGRAYTAGVRFNF